MYVARTSPADATLCINPASEPVQQNSDKQSVPLSVSVYDDHPADECVEEEDRVYRQHLALVRNDF